MSQLIKVGSFLMEIDGTRVSFFDSAGNPIGQPQAAGPATPIQLPDGQTLTVEDLAEFLGGDALAGFQTAAGGQTPPTGAPAEDSGGGRFAVFEDQPMALGGFKSVGGLEQTESAEDSETQDFAARGQYPQSITEAALPTSPVADDNALVTAEDHGLDARVSGYDPNGDPLTYILVTPPAHGALTFNADGTFTYTPEADFNGTDSFTYKVNDGNEDSNVALVGITVNPVNDLPLADDNSLTIAEDSSVASSVQAGDVDGDALSFVVIDGPQHGTLAFHADGTFTYTPDADFNGTDSFSYQANDGQADSNVARVQINVQPVNDAPVAENGTLTLAEDHSVISRVNATDVEGDNVGYVLVKGPQHGSIAFNADGTFTYTPNADYNGPDSFTYKANDGLADSHVASIGITVNPVNDVPVAANGTLTLAEDSSALSAVTAQDVDGDAVSYALVNGPQHGSIAFNADGTFTYTPNANYNGPDTFTYKANDGTGSGNIASVAINVTPVNDAPVVTSQDANTEARITRVTVDQNPFGDNKVGDYLASGGTDSKAVNPAMINGVNSSNLTLAQAADVKVSFVSEGAGYKSMVGTYTFDAKGDIDPSSVKFLWLDASQAKQNTAGGALDKDFLGNSQPQDVSLGNLAANTRMGFFIIADGASQSSNVSAIKALAGIDAKGNDYVKDLGIINSRLTFAKDSNGNGQILLDGKSLSGNVFFTHDKALNTDNVKNDIEHTLSGVTSKPDGKLYVGFEDLAGGGDKDYDDVIIKVDIGSYNINKLSLTTTQPSVDLSDIDSANLKSAAITTSGFQSGDQLNLPTNALFDVKAEAHGSDTTYTVTAKAGLASVAAFEDFLNNSFFSTATASEGHRTIAYQVTDAEGDRSNVSVADVNVTTSYEISVSELKNLAQLGSGDDTMHLNQAMTKAVDFGAGYDTAHLAQSNMNFDSADAKMLKNVEAIDAQGAGSNKVSISFTDVLDMTDGDNRLTVLGEKGDSITLSGDGAHQWTVTAHGADFTTYSFNDGVNQAIVDVSNQMAQNVA